MRDDLRLFAGGKEAFREKWVGSRGEEPASWGALDRATLEAAHVDTVYCKAAHALDGPFTTGNIARQSFERVLPNTLVEPSASDHFSEDERRGRLVLDRHPDEHATCYVVRGRGLVVVSSCSHCGVINAIRQATAVSGVSKLHGVLGGFHLDVTIAELKAMTPDVVIPMHCTGRNFVATMRAEMPEQLVDWNTGSRFTFICSLSTRSLREPKVWPTAKSSRYRLVTAAFWSSSQFCRGRSSPSRLPSLAPLHRTGRR
jgi:7,8-dihydropterin-6-yl-methyl-4-(beta-D-ribofuranosyl)aminobenzene 5'-phosphate synthase